MSEERKAIPAPRAHIEFVLGLAKIEYQADRPLRIGECRECRSRVLWLPYKHFDVTSWSGDCLYCGLSWGSFDGTPPGRMLKQGDIPEWGPAE